VAVEIVLLDHLTHVFEDLVGRCDGGAGPWLEPVAKGVQVAVGANARVLVGQPGAAKALFAFDDGETLARALGLQVVCATDAGDPSADDQHVNLFGHRRDVGIR
jgi:hypothetical protein